MKIKYAVVEDMQKIYDKTVNDLCDNKVIGWFQGSGEFGPRALGFRSLLADPRNSNIKKYLNEEVKYREWWRPYAPVVLEEHISEWFDFIGTSEYMLFSTNVNSSKQIEVSGIVHKDFTSRLQTVSKSNNEKLHSLIETFYKKTGVPMLLNTSFNLGGEPIVESPSDAYKTFKQSNIDILVMENVYLTKEEKNG